MANGQEFASSSSDSHDPFDVFLSFSGEDTRTSTFADHLYEALVRAGNRTFRDEEGIRSGEYLNSEQLVNAIQHTRCSIIVFSESYASSSRCLDELVTILACKHETGPKHYVLPIFFDVDPTNIRRQSGSVREAFAKHVERIEGEKDEGKVKELMEKLHRWRAALTDAADLSGMVLQERSDRKESKFIQKVVKVIRDNIRRLIPIGPLLVGIRERAKSIDKWLEDGSTDVNMIGICGMGGVGKTTLAKFVYNQNSERFECSCFLENVREMSKQPNGLVSLQNELLSNVSKGKYEKIFDVDEGIVKLKYAISCKRILLILDDVDHLDQLNAILGTRDWFFPGSKIILTTRHERLLKLPEVDKVYKVEKLRDDEAIKLLCFHAFGHEAPNEDFMNHVIKAVNFCGGLPLALQVVGSSLYGQKADFWASALEKLEAFPNSDILEKLKRSTYDSLQDDHDKNLFLHISCFFVGEDKDCIIRILDECEFHTTVGIQNLIDRCLLTIDSEGTLMMHQLLQDMGREIVRQESPRFPGRRSRLWHHKESFDVLKKKTGTESIECLALNMQMFKRDEPVETEPRAVHTKRPYFEEFTSDQDNPQKRRRFNFISWLSGKISSSDSNYLDLEIDAFEKMQNLKLLQLNYAKLTGAYERFPQELRWLCWHGFPSKAIPTNLPLYNVVSLDLQHSRLKQVWQGIRFLGSLKILNLSYSKGLVQTPNLSGTPKLERLILKGCTSLSEVCESIGVLEELVILDLEDCENLRKLPSSICKLTCLEKLNLSGCPNVLWSLGTTSAEIVAWSSFPWSWVLKRRDFADICTISLPSRLRQLDLASCNLCDESFPVDFSNLSSLVKLNLSNNPLQSLPKCISTLGITNLSIGSCKQLQSLHGLPETLRYLDIDGNSSLEIVTTSGGCFKLERLTDIGCPKLTEIEGCFLLEHIKKVDREVIDNLGFLDIEALGNIELNLYNSSTFYKEKRPIQGLHEFGIFSTFVPGFAVPSWFTEKKITGSYLSLVMPNTARIRCLNVCCLYQIGENIELLTWIPQPTLVTINNKTKDLTWMYCPMYCWYLSDDDDKMAWLSQWRLGDEELGGGDEVTVTFAIGNGLEVTECGYNLVLREEGENEKEERKKWGAIGGDLSDYQLSTGAYFLNHRILYRRNSEWETNKWLWNIYGDSISMKGNAMVPL